MDYENLYKSLFSYKSQISPEIVLPTSTRPRYASIEAGIFTLLQTRKEKNIQKIAEYESAIARLQNEVEDINSTLTTLTKLDDWRIDSGIDAKKFVENFNNIAFKRTEAFSIHLIEIDNALILSKHENKMVTNYVKELFKSIGLKSDLFPGGEVTYPEGVTGNARIDDIQSAIENLPRLPETVISKELATIGNINIKDEKVIDKCDGGEQLDLFDQQK